MIPRAVGIAIGLVLGVWGAPRASADQGAPTRVLLISLQACCPATAWSRAERAVKDELAAAGLQVIVERGVGDDERLRLRALMRRAVSRAAHFAVCIARAPDGRAADLWIFDALTDKTLLRQLPLVGGEGESADIAGLRVVEIMRASLLELKLRSIGDGPRPPGRAVPAPADGLVRDLELQRRRSYRRLALGLGPIGWGSPGGAGFILGLGLELHFRPWSLLSCSVDAAVSLHSAELSGPEGSADFHLVLYRLWVNVHLPVRFRLKPVLSLGVGRADAWSVGSAAGYDASISAGVARPYYSTSDRTGVVYLGGAGRLELELGEHLGLFAGLKVGGLLPQLRIRFDEREAARFGAPLFGGQLGLLLRFL